MIDRTTKIQLAAIAAGLLAIVLMRLDVPAQAQELSRLSETYLQQIERQVASLYYGACGKLC